MVRQEAGKFQSVRIRSTKGLAIHVEPNFTLEAATNLMKLEGGMYWAVGKPSVLSSEIYNRVEADTVMESGRQHKD